MISDVEMHGDGGGDRDAVATAPLITLTGRLVAAPSENPGGDERAVAAEVTRIAAELGLPAPRVLGEPTRPNLVITIDSGRTGPHLGLCGHLDTKPIGAGEWATDPTVAAVLGDELRGRGVVDMKGAVAAMLLAAADATRGGLRAGTLSLVLCADEENGATYGAQLLTERHGDLGLDWLVIGEPGGLVTDFDRLHLGSRGICTFDLEITTEQAHSGLTDELGLRSATDVAARLLTALADDFSPTRPAGPWAPTMNAGVRLEGGVTYGVVPGHATVASDCRTVPGMTRDVFEHELRQFVAQHTPDDATVTVTVRGWIDPVLLDEHHPLVACAQAASADVFGAAPPLGLFPATTDATWFAARGVACLPALGPGLLRHAHARDERVRIAALADAQRLYRRLIDRALR